MGVAICHTRGFPDVQPNSFFMKNTLEQQFIKDHLQSYYMPVDDYVQADLKLSTTELYEKLMQAFPTDGFAPSMLFSWLMELGFSYIDAGEMKIEWLLKKRIVL